jgi:hypothetical protein
MGTLALQSGGSTTFTVSVPQPNFYSVSTARLFIKVGGRDVVSFLASSFSRDSVVFSCSLSWTQLGKIADCGDCAWKGANYTVRLLEGAQALDPSFKNIDSGSVTITGDLPCSDCGGEDPPGPEEPPPGEDDPFGDPSDDGDPLIPGPDEPPETCLPPSFTAPAPTVPTPCGGGTGGSGNLAFSGV